MVVVKIKFRKNMLLYVSAQKITGIEFSKNIISKRVKNIAYDNAYYNDMTNISDFEIHIKNKNLYVLVEDERVYIKVMTIPIVKKHLINEMIKNELRYYYKDIDNIAFTYKLIKKDVFNMEILVSCLKGDKLNILKNCFDNNTNLKKVNLIQFCFKNYYCNKINEKNYILVFYYNCNLYLLICHNDEIVANNIISDKELLLFEFSNVMNEFLEQYNDYAKLCKKIYYANIKQLTNEEVNIREFDYLSLPQIMLEDLKQEELLKYIIIKG